MWRLSCSRSVRHRATPRRGAGCHRAPARCGSAVFPCPDVVAQLPRCLEHRATPRAVGPVCRASGARASRFRAVTESHAVAQPFSRVWRYRLSCLWHRAIPRAVGLACRASGARASRVRPVTEHPHAVPQLPCRTWRYRLSCPAASNIAIPRVVSPACRASGARAPRCRLTTEPRHLSPSAAQVAAQQPGPHHRASARRAFAPSPSARAAAPPCLQRRQAPPWGTPPHAASQPSCRARR